MKRSRRKVRSDMTGEENHEYKCEECRNKDKCVRVSAFLMANVIPYSDGCENFDNKGCRNCKHCSKLITEEPCMDCDPRTDSPKNHWEAEE